MALRFFDGIACNFSVTATPERRNVEIKSVDFADVGLSGKPESMTNFCSVENSFCILTQNFSKVSSSAVIVFVTPDGPRTRSIMFDFRKF